MDNKTKLNIDFTQVAQKVIDKMEETPLSLGSWLELNLSEEKLQEITNNILTKIDEIEAERKPIFEKIKQYRNQYKQIVQQTTLPFAGCFNLCYHKDTEVLTSEGWKFIKDVKVGEKVLSREPLTAKLEYKTISATQHFKNIEKLIKIKHRSFELSVTDDHRMFLEHKSKNTSRFVLAKDLKPTKGGSEGIPSSGGKWDAEEMQELFGFDADIFLEFLGWYISEGCVFKSGTVSIAQCIERKRKSIKNCLNRMGVSYSEGKNLFLVSLPVELVSYLKSLGKSWEKYIPRIFLDLPPRQLKILFDSLVAGDGHITKRGKSNREDRVTYYTSSKRLSDDIQELILKIGYSSSILERDRIGKKTMKITKPFNPIITKHLGYEITIRYTNYFDLKRIKKEYVTYNDDVYCLSINEWHTIYVRQNGKALWCGQCVPLTPKNVDACVAQTEEAFENVDPKWAIQTPPDKNLVEARDIQEKILDFYSDSEMEDIDAWEKIYHDAYLLGTGWLSMTFKREFMKVRDFVEYDTLEKFQKDYPNDWQKYPKYIESLARGDVVKLVVEYKQEIIRSAKPEHTEWEDVYVPLRTNGLEGMLKARIAARYVPKRWEEILISERDGDYRPGVAETLKKKMGSDGRISEEIDPDYIKKTFDTFEVIYFVDIDADEIEERCLFNVEKSHKLCLRAIRYPYNHNRPHLIPYYIQRTNNTIYDVGMGEKLQPLNIALNAIINHVLNASVIANSLSLKVRAGTDAVKALFQHRWYPGSILELMNPDDVQQFNFSTPNLSSLINLFAIVERFGEDISGLVNYTFGQESQDDPQAPASKTIALMRKSEIKLRRYIKNLKRSNNEAGYQALRLIYQYVPKTRIAKILGIELNKVTEIFQYPLKPITQSSGFAIEKMFEKKDNMQMLDLLMKDPIVAGDPKRRVVGYRILAKDWGSNWDKKIEYLVPTVKELEEDERQQEEMAKNKKMEFLKRAATEALNNGASPEEAKEIAMKALEAQQVMAEQKQLEANKADKGGGK